MSSDVRKKFILTTIGKNNPEFNKLVESYRNVMFSLKLTLNNIYICHIRVNDNNLLKELLQLLLFVLFST